VGIRWFWRKLVKPDAAVPPHFWNEYSDRKRRVGRLKTPVVAIITPGSFVIPSGRSSSVELVVEEVARRLIPEVRPVVFGIMGEGKPRSEWIEGVRYTRVRAASAITYISQVSKKIRLYKPAIIQVENRPRFVGYLRKRYPKAVIWLVLHSVTFITGPHIGLDELRSCLDAADKIVVNSHFMKAQILRKAPRVKGKVIVNYLGVDTERFTSRWTLEGAVRRQQCLEQLDLADKKIIMYVGRLIEMKGVHHLLAAMPEIAAQIPNAMLLVVGGAYYGSQRTTSYVKQLHRLSGRLTEQQVRFIPYVPHTEIADWFRLADVLVVPSNANEAFGLVNVEAMASGVPVVATRVGGMKEIIEHGRTGFLIDPHRLEQRLATYIIRLLTEPGLAPYLGNASHGKVQEQFTWERTAERWVKWYKDLQKTKKK
jgi:spore coat protein SA